MRQIIAARAFEFSPTREPQRSADEGDRGKNSEKLIWKFAALESQSRSDFELLQDGEPQKITHFASCRDLLPWTPAGLSPRTG